MAILTADNIFYSYDKKHNAVDGISLSVDEGEHIAIIGHNGSGKSTLAKLFNGILKADGGTITVDGIVRGDDKKNLFEIRKRVGVVFQNPDNQLVASIVEDDVAFGPENLGVKRDEIAKRIDFALKSVGMEEFRKSSPTRLSGGQKQRIAIAGVLAIKPKILILDESTAMLDPIGRREILEVVDKLNKEQGVTVIAITHYMEEVISADRVFVLDRGRIALTGKPREIFKQKDYLKRIGLELPTPSYIASKLIEKKLIDEAEILTDLELLEALCK